MFDVYMNSNHFNGQILLVLALMTLIEMSTNYRTALEYTIISKCINSRLFIMEVCVNANRNNKVVNGAYKWIGNTASGTFIDKDVKSEASYTYKVGANKGSMVSAFSAPKTAKAK